MDRSERSAIGKMQQKYWTTKHALVYKKFGIKQEDQCIVASDSELDMKLELFGAIQMSCDDLLRIIENYQDRICSLAHEENALGRFLKENGKIDKTRAGKMMSAVGKTMSYTAQQRLALRVPLVRLYQEVETFRNRAVVDSGITVNKMETSRTNYRGALLWMKDVSQELDPDTYKRLEKFRKVQSQVKKSKGQFDKLKLDTCQKIDLLSASRCNMFSRILATYENTLVQFWERTARTLTHVSDCFRGYQHYEFSMLKELTEPSKKLAEQTSKDVKDDDELVDASCKDDHDRSLFFDGEYHDSPAKSKTTTEDTDLQKKRSDSLVNLLDPSAILEQEKLVDLVNGISIDSDRQADVNGTKMNSDLLTNNPEVDDNDKDDLTLLNEILNIPTTTSCLLTQTECRTSITADDDKWLTSLDDNLRKTTNGNTNENSVPNFDFEALTSDIERSNEFLPSHLLDLRSGFVESTTNGNNLQSAGFIDSSNILEQKPIKDVGQKDSRLTNGVKNKKKDMSAWYELFADLDPLANPDAVGQSEDIGTNDQRNC